jgi:hypothetical protein
LCVVSLLALNASLAPTTLSQSGGNIVIKPSTITGGGGSSSAGSLRLEGSIGQDILGSSSGGSYLLEGGFWPNGVPCPFMITTPTRRFTSRGGQMSIDLLALSDCSWTASADEPWIVFTSETSGSGKGVVSVELRENMTAAARQGTITIGDFAMAIVQDATTAGQCVYSVVPKFGAYPVAGGADYIDVTADGGCGWEAVSSAEWIKVTSGWVGAGDGRLTYYVAPNAGARRKGEITIGKTKFSIKQSGT